MNKGVVKLKKKEFVDKAQMKKRMFISLVVLFTVFAILICRLSYIMIIKRAEYSAMATEQWTSEVKIDARRGRIVDRNGTELAVSADVYRVDFDLNSIRKYLSTNQDKKDSGSTSDKLYTTNEQLAPVIADAVGMTSEDVLKKLETKLSSGDPAGSAILVRRIEKDVAEKVKALDIYGVMISADTKRYYPQNNFLSHVLGCTNVDGKGLTGVELQYDSELSGVPGRKISELGGNFPYTISEYTEPVNGKDISLTIDENIQYFAEKAASQCYADNKAKAVSILITDPKTGEILAMVNKPDFNPNTPFEGIEGFEGKNESDKRQKMWRNRLVNDTFEPGSIFKVITAITAMENNAVSENDAFTCTGSMVIGGTTIRCAKTEGHGVQTFPQIIQNSCNPGFMQLGAKIGKETLCESIKNFGFGSVSGIDLPGEATGIVKNVKDVSPIDLATISFGQTNTVNSVQYMAAFNSIANGGTLIQPHIMKEISETDDSGATVISETFNPTKKTVASEEKTKTLRSYLENVVTAGSGTATFIEGYHIGGKTGTAQKVIDGKYADGKYISSFVGMAPVDDPKVTIMITVDEPSNNAYYAGQVAVPYAKTLFLDIFNYMEGKFSKENEKAIVKDVIIPEVRGLKIEDAKKALSNLKINCEVTGDGAVVKSIQPYPGYAIKEGTTITISTEGENNNSVIMPDVRGYSLSDAKALLDSLNLQYTILGDGTIIEQGVTPGELIKKGSMIKLKLGADYEEDITN